MRRTYLTRRQRQALRIQNRLSILAGVIGLFLIAVGLYVLWGTNGADLTLKAYGDRLGLALLVTLAGLIGVAVALIGYETE